MNRQKLIDQVKNEYARFASEQSLQHPAQSTDTASPEAYYEKLLNRVLEEISAGKFDSFNSGTEIVEAVANNKQKWLPGWSDPVS